MAERVVDQLIEEFAGINLKNSDLSREQRFFRSLKNFEPSTEGYSIRGKKGVQVCGKATGSSSYFTYSKSSQETGATEQEIICWRGGRLYKLVKRSLTVTKTSGANFGWTVRVDTSTNTYKFVLTQGGVAVLTQDLGTGLEQAPYTVWDLYLAIDALANFTCSAPPKTAKLNGNYGGVGNITVESGHTLSQYDLISFNDENGNLFTMYVTALPSATLVSTSGADDMVDNQVLGIGACPAASIPVEANNENSQNPKSLYYYSWEPIWGGFLATNSAGSGGFGSFVNFTNINEECVITGKRDAVYSSTPIAGQPSTAFYYHSPLVYDGRFVYKLGVPQVSSLTVATGAAGAIPNGTYKYIGVYKIRNSRGVSYVGNPSPQVEVTVSGGSKKINITVSNASYLYSTNSVFKDLGVRVTSSGGGLSSGTITIEQPHPVEVGDYLVLHSSTTKEYGASHGPTRLKVATVSGGAITFESHSAFTISNSEYMTLDASIEIYRTKVGGVKYYQVVEIPLSFTSSKVSSTQTLIDNTPDANLGVEFEYPEIGREHDLPPVGEVACSHQRNLVISRINQEPNSVYISDPESHWYFPLERSSFDIPSQVTSAITGVISDADSRLAVFKENSYFDIPGDFTISPANFNILTKTDGDYGVSGQRSLSRVAGRIVGVGKRGVIAIENGEIVSDNEGIPSFGRMIEPAILNNPNIMLDVAMGFNDWKNGQYILNIPALSSAIFDHTNSGGYDPFAVNEKPYSNNLVFVYDYKSGGKWFNRSYQHCKGIDDGAGRLILNEEVYLAGLNGNRRTFNATDFGTFPNQNSHLFREHTITNPLAEAYMDNHLAPSYEIITQPFHRNIPSTNKKFLFLHLFSMYGEYEQENFVQAALRIYSYRDFQYSVTHTTGAETFSALSEFEKVLKLKDGRARAMAFKIVCDTAKHCPQITALQLIMTENYEEGYPVR